MSEPDFVVFDIDGVLADFTHGFTRILEGRGRSTGTQETFHFRQRVSGAWEIADSDRTFWLGLYPIVTGPEIVEMHRLAERAEIVYLTGRHEGNSNDTFGQTRDWLHLHDFPHGTLMMARDKLPILRGYGPHLKGVIEDRPDTCVEMYAQHLPVYVRDWQYNRDVGRNVPRVSSVGEFIAIMERSL